jgi:pyruvate formate lyase activating enzyme
MIENNHPSVRPFAHSSARSSHGVEAPTAGMVKGILQETVEGGARCGVCIFRCVVPEGKRGRCGTRANVGGCLYSLVYGAASSISVNPIEKKPVYHYLPGSRWLSVGTFGCNFLCPGCQNWELAHAEPETAVTGVLRIMPDELVREASEAGCVGISWTFNEPAVWLEYVLEGASRARASGLHTNVVTNASFTREALNLLAPHIEVFRADIKGFSQETYRQLAGRACLDEVLETVRRSKVYWGMHVEVVTNVIPGVSDDMNELAGLGRWIKEELGPDTPWHLTRFWPAHQMAGASPTPVRLLEKRRSFALKNELRFVYLGNVPGHEGENTWCPSCGKLLIRRAGLRLAACHLAGRRCPTCGEPIPGTFQNE